MVQSAKLTAEKVNQHEFININCYQRTISAPTYENNNLKLDASVVTSLNEI